MVKIFLLKIKLINRFHHKIISKIFQYKNKAHKIHIYRNMNNQEINKKTKLIMNILNKINNTLRNQYHQQIKYNINFNKNKQLMENSSQSKLINKFKNQLIKQKSNQKIFKGMQDPLQ